ncbi:hypothetical protein HA466_0058850 [Hirschfeldia incana]|nr:hypothetical protein HA466_0058850 [Hirschfeldia incana]KAJ0259547.1 hypothetical protein HA466_0058850 [Hirschfeldia incana]
MHEFSTVDGFAEINESLAEMIKYIANEPSVGLYYIQQHVRNAAPNVLNLSSNVLDKSRETGLHTEDLDDSIAMVRSMKEFGSPVADEMIGDIKSSLALMMSSKQQPRRGGGGGVVVLNSRRSPWSRSNSVTTTRGSDYISQENGEGSGYFTSVFKSAKEKASSIKWPQIEFKNQKVESSPNVDEQVLKEASLKAWLGDVDGDAGVGGRRAAERI